MLKRAAIALAIVIALALIDRASLWFAPCGPGGGGIVVAGAKLLLEFGPEVWTALATIAVAAFTLTLWLSSEKMWKVTARSIAVARRSADAAERSAKTAELSLLSVEIPYLYPFIRTHGIKTQRHGTEMQQITGFNYGGDFIKYYFRNFGRTPAEITEVFAVVRFAAGLPSRIPVPDRPNNVLSGRVIAADRESEDFPCALTPGMYASVGRGEFDPQRDIVWFMGYVRYKDIFDNEYARGFCLRFAPNDGTFFPAGGDGYNYRKKTPHA